MLLCTCEMTLRCTLNGITKQSYIHSFFKKKRTKGFVIKNVKFNFIICIYVHDM